MSLKHEKSNLSDFLRLWLIRTVSLSKQNNLSGANPYLAPVLRYTVFVLTIFFKMLKSWSMCDFRPDFGDNFMFADNFTTQNPKRGLPDLAEPS